MQKLNNNVDILTMLINGAGFFFFRWLAFRFFGGFVWVFWGLLWVLWFLSGVKGWAVVAGGCVACGGFLGGFLPCFGSFARSDKIADEKNKNH